jgi:PPK2 family polyphosphate:nucleotide phosphotransferase
MVHAMPKPLWFEPVENPYLVPFDGSFKIKNAVTVAKNKPKKDENVAALAAQVEQLSELQSKLYAHDRFSLILIFQALDAAGKDGTIRAVMSGVNPQGCQVYAFKQPSSEELDHDFMWRVQRALPERGRIGIFNRSHYEEVLVVRVHPNFLESQKLPSIPDDLDDLWDQRFDSIKDAERHWARNGAVILKFFLNVSQKEQHARFLSRIEEMDHQWKFSPTDSAESEHFDDYMNAYEQALNETSQPWAPWYCIPADSKSHMRRIVAETIVSTLAQLPLEYPEVSPEMREEMEQVRRKLRAELKD